MSLAEKSGGRKVQGLVELAAQGARCFPSFSSSAILSRWLISVLVTQWLQLLQASRADLMSPAKQDGMSFHVVPLY